MIVGNDLKKLIKKYNICNEKQYDITSIKMDLGDEIIRLVPNKLINELIYGEPIPNECILREKIAEDGIIIKPKTSLIACSSSAINMPLGYFGLLQTKGSLARMMISIHFSDGQIDPWFKGNVTYEIFNGSDFNIKLYKKQFVGNLYIFKTSTKNIKPYNGKYSNSTGPTIYIN